FLVSSRPALTGVAEAAAAIPVSTSPASIAAGAALIEKNRCNSCHAIGTESPSESAREARAGLPRGAAPISRLGAPDLAHTRDRMSPSDIAAFIANPAAFN